MNQSIASVLCRAWQSARRPAWPVALGLMSVLSLAVAVPSQVPLASRTAPPPEVNLMLTIDDSASMLFEFMPEGDFTVNGKTVHLGYTAFDATNKFIANFWPSGFPGDAKKGPKSGQTWDTGVVYAGSDLLQKQFRSPDVNSLYYNPDKVYRPWISADDPTKEMIPAVYGAALYYPLKSGTINLSDTATTYTDNWCGSYLPSNAPLSVCGSADRPITVVVYRLNSSTADPNSSSSYTAYNLNGSNWAPSVKHPNRTDCKNTKCTKAEEQQNFANWFTYHRSRIHIFKGALGRSLVNHQNKVRIGFAIYNMANGKLNSSDYVQQGLTLMDLSVLKTTLANIYAIDPDSSTPGRLVLDAVGKYFQKTGSDSPWKTTPGSSEELSCRRAANFVMTDGYYNDSYTAAGDQDGAAGPDYSPAYPTGSAGPTKYSPAAPYSDGRSNTMADVAMKYYKTDLQPGIANKIVPVQGDIAYWQHLTQYMVGLGVKGVLDASTPAAKDATLAAIAAGSLPWPDPTPANSQAPRIDDMWHAAVNTGGDFYSVSDSDGLSAAIAESLGKATGGEAKEAGVSVSSEAVVAGSVKFVPRYNSGNWSGGLDAFTLKADGSQGSKKWSATIPVDVSPTTKGWQARPLYTWTGTAPEPFVYATLSSANQSTMVSEALTNWVRGDTSNEDPTDPYRSRAGNPFGDFVDSPPVYVKDPVDLGYAAMDASYSAYKTAKAARGAGIVFLGGNDGIMHAFNGDTGVEIFGFLPQAGLGKLSSIAQKTYGDASNPHQFVVDGWAFETDAYIPTRSVTSAAWSNLVVGSMGAGGRGLFALHVPTSLGTSPTLDGNAVLWELSSSHATYGADIGYIMGRVAVGKIQGGTISDGWKAFVGNGVDSATGKAALLIVDLATGAVDKELTVDTSGNGLLGVSLIYGAKNEVIGAYAGDLKGNLWRFDFGSATDAASWKVGFSGQPLVNVGQAVTAAPLSTVRTDGVGRVVVFGTGKLLTTSDIVAATVEKAYGVLDPTSAYGSSVGTASPFAGVTNIFSKLAPRTITWNSTPINGVVYASITGTAVDWVTQLGWVAALPNGGERTLLTPMRLVGNYVLLQTMVPGPTPVPCEPSYGTAYNYIIDMTTGKAATEPIFDTNNDGKVNSDDASYTGYYKQGENKVDGVRDIVIVDPAIAGGGGGTPPLVCKAEKGYKLVYIASTATTGQWACLPDGGGGCDPKVQTCQCDPKAEVCSYSVVPKDRVWRQILNPPQ